MILLLLLLLPLLMLLLPLLSHRISSLCDLCAAWTDRESTCSAFKIKSTGRITPPAGTSKMCATLKKPRTSYAHVLLVLEGVVRILPVLEGVTEGGVHILLVLQGIVVRVVLFI